MTILMVKGPEELLAQRAITRFRKQLRQQHPDLEEIRIDVAEYNTGMLAQATAPTLFGGAKLVYLDSVEKMNDAFQKDMTAYLEQLDPDISLILRVRDNRRGRKLITAISKVAQVEECAEIKWPDQKLKLVLEDVRAAKRQITRPAAQALVDALGSDVMELAAAVAQLLDDVPGKIDEAAVNRYYSQRVEATAFQVTDLAVAGNLTEALVMARHALRTGVDPAALIGALAAKLRAIALVREGHTTAMTPFQLKEARKVARNWSDERLARAITAVADADSDIKGGSLDREFALERAVRLVAMNAR